MCVKYGATCSGVSGVPLVHFGTNTAHLLDLMKDEGGTVMGLDWRVPLDVAWARVGHEMGVP